MFASLMHMSEKIMNSASGWACCFEDYNHYSWFPWLVLLFQVNKLLCDPVLKLCVCMSKTSLNSRGSITGQVCCLNDGADQSTFWKRGKLWIINMKPACMLIQPRRSLLCCLRPSATICWPNLEVLLQNTSPSTTILERHSLHLFLFSLLQKVFISHWFYKLSNLKKNSLQLWNIMSKCFITGVPKAFVLRAS